MSGEKTEQPSAKKLRQARLDGQVPRSVELTGMTTFVVVFVVLAVTFPTIVKLLVSFFERSIAYGFAPPKMSVVFIDAGTTFASILAPVFVASFVVALIVGYVQIGPVFSTKAVMPDSKRINPGEGFKRIFSKDTLVQFAKHVSKLVVISIIAISVYTSELPLLVQSARLDFVQGWALFGGSVTKLAIFMGIALLMFGLTDYLWQRHSFMKKMMMSHQEVKDEYKEAEGDPSLKGQRRRMHREMAREASLSRVKDADAVVVNPTHIAVALQYDDTGMDAPVVLSSGRGETAERIRKEAKRYNVPIVRNVPLARSLSDLSLDEEIPEELYDSVAEVLRYVYALDSQ